MTSERFRAAIDSRCQASAGRQLKAPHHTHYAEMSNFLVLRGLAEGTGLRVVSAGFATVALWVRDSLTLSAAGSRQARKISAVRRVGWPFVAQPVVAAELGDLHAGGAAPAWSSPRGWFPPRAGP